MKSVAFLLIFIILVLTKEIIYEKIADSKFSNAELINNNIIICYNGGISKYSYNLTLISEIPIGELELNSYSDIHQINENMIIIESSRVIYLIEKDIIKYKINFDSISYFRQVLVINNNSYLVLKVELTTSLIHYCLYNTESNTPIKIYNSKNAYNRYSCSLSSLLNNKYIICFLLDDKEIYYNIFDSNLNQIISDTKINIIERNIKINYISTVSISDTKIILLINSINESPLRRLVIDEDMLDQSFLQVFEFKEDSGNFLIEKIWFEEDFIVYDQIYMGNNIFHMRKIDEEELVVVFPVDETKKEFYFSIIEFKNDILTIKEGYKNVPLSFKHEIQGLKFLKINSDYAISFYFYNNEEVEEIQEVFISYLTTKNCRNFQISTFTNTQANIDFSKYIFYDLIPPEVDKQKMKINNNNTSISFLYDNNPMSIENYYGFNNWTYNSGEEPGIYEIFYTVFSSNDYMNKECKIIFNISINESSNSENDENIILENEIKNKIKELKKKFKEN